MYSIIIRRKQTTMPLIIRAGQIIEVEDIHDFKMLAQVPDCEHQSSLDYLKGV